MLDKESNELLTGTGAGTPMGELFRRFWIPFLMSEELPAPDCPPVRVKLLGEELVAFRDTNGEVGLISAYCAHRRAPLFYGRNGECGLRCVYHGWKFDAQGQCVDMPSEPPESSFKEKVQLTAYPTKERGGMIWTYMGPEEEMPELPNLEWAMVPDDHRYMAKFLVNANYMQAMEGDLDSSHVSFLHSTLDNKLTGGGGGINRNQNLQKYWIENKNPKFFVKDSDHGLLIGAQRNADAEHYFWRITQWLMPCYSIIPAEVGNPILCNVRIPIDDEHSWHIRIMWHPERPLTDQELYAYQHQGVVYPETIPGTFKPVANKDNDYLIDRAQQKTSSYTGIKAIPVQDMAMFEGMGSIIDRSLERLGTSDAAIIQTRRKLLKAAQELQEGKEPYAAKNGNGYHVRSASLTIKRDVEFEVGAKDYLEAKIWK